MKLSTPFAIASLAMTATAAVVGKVHRKLDVNMEKQSNSAVKISLTNNGDKELHLLNKGTILDASPVQKIHVFKGAEKQKFTGMKKRVSVNHGLEKMLTPIKKGQTIDVHVDAAQLHDLSGGGKFGLLAKGSIPYAEVGANKLSGVVKFESKLMDVDIDGNRASHVAKFEKQKRSQLQSDCTGDYGAATNQALHDCVGLANDAADFALNGDSAKMIEYFKTDDTETRTTVNERLVAVANECSTNTTGATTYYCNDASVSTCDEGVLAYTYPDSGEVVNCALYYSYLPALATDCHQQDMATTTLHEFTHANPVYSPGTDDNAYGYDACMDLDTEGAVNNADTYALFANAVNLSC